MKIEEKKFEIYLIVLRFLPFKITKNLQKIYVDISLVSGTVLLTAYYKDQPSELDIELLDDIETNSSAHIPDLSVDSIIKLVSEYKKNEFHDFTAFAVYEELPQ
jgi:hypothetical protein